MSRLPFVGAAALLLAALLVDVRAQDALTVGMPILSPALSPQAAISFTWRSEATDSFAVFSVVPILPSPNTARLQSVDVALYTGNSSSLVVDPSPKVVVAHAAGFARLPYWDTPPVYVAAQYRSTSAGTQPFVVLINSYTVAITNVSLPFNQDFSVAISNTGSVNAAAKPPTTSIRIVVNAFEPRSTVPLSYNTYIKYLNAAPTLADVKLFSTPAGVLANKDASLVSTFLPQKDSSGRSSVYADATVRADNWTLIAVIATTTSGTNILYGPVADYYCSATVDFQACINLKPVVNVVTGALVAAIVIPILICLCCTIGAIIFCVRYRRRSYNHMGMRTM